MSEERERDRLWPNQRAASQPLTVSTARVGDGKAHANMFFQKNKSLAVKKLSIQRNTRSLKHTSPLKNKAEVWMDEEGRKGNWKVILRRSLEL